MSAPRLGEILLQRSVVTPEALGEALQGQVIYGGKLGTNLLELGAVTEQHLAQALGVQHGSPALWGDIGPEPAALALLQGERVERFGLVPLRLEGRRLLALVDDPRNLRRLDELAFALGKDVRPVVVAESRLWELQRRHYGLVRPLRGVAAVASRLPAPAAAAGPPAHTPVPDLMREEDFAALYDTAHVAGRPLAPPAPPGPPAPTPAPPRRPTPPPLPRAQADAFRGALVSTDEVLAALQLDAEQRTERDGKAIQLTPAGALEPPPLTYEEAGKALQGAGDREAIAQVVLRCARSRFRRALLLTVHGQAAEGWAGMGQGLTPQTVARVRAAVDQPGLFQTVVGSRAHFLGPLQKTDANVRFLRALGGGAPRNSFAMPILARGQVVNVLYADNGRGQLVDPSAVGELLILAAQISRSWDVLLSRAR